jgi:hypothetical protein
VLCDRQGTVVVSSLGWVDGGTLWTFRPADGVEATLPLEDAKYLTLVEGRDDHFAIVHHYDADRIEVTVHRFADPQLAIARAAVGPDGTRLSGAATAWGHVQRSYVAFYRGPFWANYALVRIAPAEGRVELQQFEWFTDDEYDKGYQGIVGVTEVPDADVVLVSIQRDSRPVLYDPVAREMRERITLAERHGNPRLFFRRNAAELWVDDYDTLLKLEPGTWRTLAARRLQDAAEGTMHFIGQFAFDADETLCVVARPFSEDVIGVDPDTLDVDLRWHTDGQPIEAVALPDRSAVARDWKTGRLLRGRRDRA